MLLRDRERAAREGRECREETKEANRDNPQARGKA
jgi:hypothetical protein